MAWLATLLVILTLLLPDLVPAIIDSANVASTGGAPGRAVGRAATAFLLGAVAVKGWAWLQDDLPAHPKTHAHINWSALCIGGLSWVISFIQ